MSQPQKRYYSGLLNIKELEDVHLVNEHLGHVEWEFLGAHERDIAGKGRSIIYLVGEFRQTTPTSQPTATAQSVPQTHPPDTVKTPPASQGPPATIEERIRKLPFKEFGTSGNTWWSVGPNDIPQDIVEWLIAKTNRWEDGSTTYTYSVQKGWLSRKTK